MENPKRRCFMKLAWRRNLIYPCMLSIWILLRKGITSLLDKFFNFSTNLFFTLLMFAGELFAGLILYFYQKSFLRKNKTNNDKKNALIFSEGEMKMPDSKIKIYFLIFVISFFDFIEYILLTNYIPKFPFSSGSLDLRSGGIMTIISALFFYYLLKLPILRHQFFSLCNIAICLTATIILEYIFQDINYFISYWDLSLKILLIITEQFFNALLDCIENYCVNYNNYNCFKVLSLEGLFGSIITGFYLCFERSYLIQFKEIFSEHSGEMLALFIFLLFIYIVLCGLKNAYRVITNKIYSPMTKSLTDYFSNPFYLILHYIEGDFISGGKQSIIYFSINFILSIITNLFGCVFNEIIILFFCDFERETHNQISFRSTITYRNDLSEINDNTEEEEDILDE